MKSVTSRQFLHGFAKVQKGLAPGESITITKHGKPLGKFVKESTKSRKLPDFRKEVEKDGYGPKVGDELLRLILGDEALS
jgi:antitoxin (DNA-binding transcriptional repressor) of toxin-antitoxin stability system